MNISLLLSNIVIGPLLIIIALIIRAFPPKHVNWAYGYRTSRSKKSQESWEAANKYSNELMLWIGIVTSVTQIILYQFLTPLNVLIIASIIMCTLLIIMIFIVEKHLKDNFDENGNKKG